MSASLVRTLAEMAGLPLAAGRAEAAARVFDAWLPAANELSVKMSAAEHQTLLPATVFAHVPPEGES